MAAFGLVADRPPLAPAETFALWPENVPAFELWLAVQTQWRMGPNGPIGLDYAGVEAHMRCGLRMRPRQLRRRWGELRAMEQAALEEFAQRRR